MKVEDLPVIIPGGTATEGPHQAAGELAGIRFLHQRVTLIWALLFFNTLPPIGVTVLPIPQRVAQLLTMGSLAFALLLALSLNRKLLIRPNVVMGMFSLLAATSFMASVRGTAGIGGVLRGFRLLVFLAVLWLLTPLWGRRDLLLARCHLRVLTGVLTTVIIGLLVAPSAAQSINGRLGGALWPIWPTAVGHFAAAAGGLAIVLWFAGLMSGRAALGYGGVGATMILLSQTRVALVGLAVGIACAGVTLLVTRRRVRRTAAVMLVLVPAAAIVLAPQLLIWFTRGQSSQEFTDLTGRKPVWDLLLSAPRPTFAQWFGYGLSDKSFAGKAIDNTWLAIYQDQGWVGMAIVGAIFIYLIASAALSPPSPSRAIAVFILVYCLADSYTEVGIGDASPYLLDLVVAASLLLSRPAERLVEVM